MLRRCITFSTQDACCLNSCLFSYHGAPPVCLLVDEFIGQNHHCFNALAIVICGRLKTAGPVPQVYRFSALQNVIDGQTALLWFDGQQGLSHTTTRIALQGSGGSWQVFLFIILVHTGAFCTISLRYYFVIVGVVIFCLRMPIMYRRAFSMDTPLVWIELEIEAPHIRWHLRQAVLGSSRTRESRPRLYFITEVVSRSSVHPQSIAAEYMVGEDGACAEPSRGNFCAWS